MLRDPALVSPYRGDDPDGGARPAAQPARSTISPLLLQYWNAVLRRRWTIVGIVATFVVVALVATLLTAPRYTASVQLEISREQKRITNVQSIESEEAGRDMEFYATQYALLKTRPIAERVSSDLRLAGNDEFFAAHGVQNAGGDLAAGGRERIAVREKLAIDLLLANVDIVPVRTSRLVNVNYTSRSPDFSARIANAWTAAFIAKSMERQLDSTADARRILERRLANLRQRLEESERMVVSYASDEGIVTLDQTRDSEGKTQSTRTLAANNLDALNTALNVAIDARVLAESRLRAAGSTTSEALSSPALAGLRQQRAQVAAEYAKMLVQYEAGYPTVEALARQRDALDTAIRQETDRIAGGRTQEYRQSLQRETELRAEVERLRGSLTKQQRAGIQWNVYQRDADTNRQLYDALLQRYKEIGIAANVGANNISVVEPAQIPVVPSSPKLFLNLALALVGGLMVAGVVVIALEQLDDGVREPAEVQTLLGLPLLGNTPNVEGNVVHELNDAKSHLYEAYFSVRSNLAFTTSHGLPRTLSVTSTRPAEGKSSTALALALVMGRTGKNVLLIDADMRSPSQHDLVGCPNTAGLSNYLAGDDDWQRNVQETLYKGVSLIAAGPTPPSPAELLTGERLPRFIASVAGQYDHVVIDSPPILGLTDAPILGEAVEGCILVVEAGGVPVRGIRSSIARLEMVHAHVFGVILTKLQQRRGGYGYGYGYGYGGDRYGDDRT
ncbi:polysaccharide biosynthesis tyrosine autokinase [Microvirga sp. SRT01]|uniref:non-specific protein-tyrosine kinase n=1 Tax=Sphingomonas longa TaxID=2778730 RepID=A0ABS2DC03_9SPHN|nr:MULTISPECIES: polysaccharide biosynthesis tyrosine autokinase [Alphaproteobacteria]MBM6578469.1 polysaccharide biosynthesis tyrosine autokinase [Sphingomonas sp. BT552]MBR7711509.1 polysaccharide biosynthesis tyrosine autokinase [Microvirga sp. SRT01]